MTKRECKKRESGKKGIRELELEIKGMKHIADTLDHEKKVLKDENERLKEAHRISNRAMRLDKKNQKIQSLEQDLEKYASIPYCSECKKRLANVFPEVK